MANCKERLSSERLHEGIWKRAYRDTADRVKSVKFAFALTLSNVVAVIATYSTLNDPTTGSVERYLVLTMSVSAAFIALLIITFLGVWVATPFRQRNEARDRIEYPESGPKLYIFLDESLTYITNRVVDLEGQPQGFFIHVVVKNDSPTVAKGCKARLIKYERKKDGIYQNEKGFRSPIPLFWAHEGRKEVPIDIEEDIPRLLDVCNGIEYSNSAMNMVHVPLATPQFARGSAIALVGPGEYRLTIRVNAENASSHVDGRFIIRIGSKWNDIKISAADTHDI